VSESTARKQCERGGIFDISNAEKKNEGKSFFFFADRALLISLTLFSALLSSKNKQNQRCFSPTDVGIWEVERPKSSGGTRGANFSVGGSGGGSGTGPRGFFSSILGGGSGGGGGAGGGSGGGETK
jgi:hypothetical protein